MKPTESELIGGKKRHYIFDAVELCKRNEHAKKVQSMIADETDECILWDYFVLPDGYGAFYDKVLDKKVRVHRLALVLAKGQPPSDAPFACHNCRTRNCFNPKHLRWDTPRQNIMDKSNWIKVKAPYRSTPNPEEQ